MIILVCGGRKYTNKPRVWSILTKIHTTKPIDVLIEGGAKGADTLAREWAYEAGVHCATVPALWHKMGDAAGPPRNSAMALLRPSLVVAFPGNGGTRDMMNTAHRANIKLLIIRDN